jgi:excisionase family DNA binding protein
LFGPCSVCPVCNCPQVTVLGTADRRALKTILDLSLRGASDDGAALAERSAAAWEVIARAAIGTGSVTLASVGSPSQQPRWVTVSEAAELMDVSPGLVPKLCRQGAIRARRHGRRVWAIDRDSAAEWKGRR